MGSADAEDWKFAAFSSLVDKAPKNCHLISIGDSVFERNAAHFAGSEYHAASVKTVKFIDPWEGPTIQQVATQLSRLTAEMRQTIDKEYSLDLEMVFDGSHLSMIPCGV